MFLRPFVLYCSACFVSLFVSVQTDYKIWFIIRSALRMPKATVPMFNTITSSKVTFHIFSVDKKNQLDVTFCILYFSSNSCSTCFEQPCAHHQELTTAWCYSLVLVCAVAAGRLSRPVGRQCVTLCIFYFSSNSCSTCFGQPCAHHQELTTALCYSLVLVCAVAAGRLSSLLGIRYHFLYYLFLF